MRVFGLFSAVVFAMVAEQGASAADELSSVNLWLNTFGSACQFSYRSDSYGRGLEAGFRGVDLRPDLVDEGCYQLGVERGHELLEGMGTLGIGECRRQFEAGLDHGFSLVFEIARSECYDAGYSAGSAKLRIGARRGDKRTVGAACVDEYQRGRGDSLAGRVEDPLHDARLSFCYGAGYFDAPMDGYATLR
jgi:hypothetical protein